MHVSLQLRSHLTFEDCLLLEALLRISVRPGPNLQFFPCPAAPTKEQPSENDRSSRGLIQAENNSGKCGRLVALEVLQTKRE